MQIQDILLKFIIFAYGATAIIDIVAYWPTINDLWRNKKQSANLKSYLLWSTTTGIGFLYSLFVLSDLLLRIVSGVIFLANISILVLVIRLKS